jgi:acyl dehydratase
MTTEGFPIEGGGMVAFARAVSARLRRLADSLRGDRFTAPVFPGDTLGARAVADFLETADGQPIPALNSSTSSQHVQAVISGRSRLLRTCGAGS